MMVVIETDRLLLRTFTEHDGLLIYDLNRDPDVSCYTYENSAYIAEILPKTILPQYALYN